MMKISSSWEGGYRCRVRVRDFEIVADEPPDQGGTDAGPMPTEMLLASLASCFTMALAHVARKRGIELPDLEVHATASYDRLRLGSIRLEVHSSHPRDDLEALIPAAARSCYVSNTLKTSPTMEYVVAG
jgi:putative redox protein